jgi:anti-anti-sigma factor
VEVLVMDGSPLEDGAFGPSFLDIGIASGAGTLRIALRGELDIESGRDLAALASVARRGDEQFVVFDLTGLSFIDAAGLDALASVGVDVAGDPRRVDIRGATGIVARVLALCAFPPVRSRGARLVNRPAADAPL